MSEEQGGKSGQIGETALKILLLVSQGKTNKEIAKELGFSDSNVEGHIGRLNKLLGTSSRTEAAIKGLNLAYYQQLEEAREECRRLSQELDEVRKSEQAARESLSKNFDMMRDALKESPKLKRLGQWGRRFEQTLTSTHGIVYELDSLRPVSYRFMSASAQRFGIDVASVLSGRTTFYELIHPEDLEQISLLSPEETLAPGKRYTLTYRLLTPEPRWMMDVHRALYNGKKFLCVQGLVVDVDEMVQAGLVSSKVSRTIEDDV